MILEKKRITSSAGLEEAEADTSWELPDLQGGASGFFLRVAKQEKTRRISRRLSNTVYRSKGYLKSEAGDRKNLEPVSASDARVLLITQGQQHAVGTVSLAFDGATPLPSHNLFPVAIDELRSQGRRLIEAVRFAVHESFQGHALIKTRLLNILFRDALIEQGADDLIAEVHPRHVGFYVRLLKFEPLREARPCPRVGGSPAVLLRLRRSTYQLEAPGVRTNQKEVASPKLRGLYKRFLTVQQEEDASVLLRRTVFERDFSVNACLQRR